MTSESEFLLAALRREDIVPPATIDWQALLELADSHGVLTLFCKRYSGKRPGAFVSRVHSQWIAAASLTSELEGLLEQFCLHGVEVLPLKGPLLAQVLYGSPGLRRSDDLDLLVQRQDFDKARSLLIDLGFAPVYQTDDYHQTFQRRDTCIELHFSVAPPSSPAMDLDRVWERAPVVQFRGQTARFFANPDLLVYLVIHGVKHEFARLIWVLDAARALGKLSEDDLTEVFNLSKALGIEGAFLFTCALARYSSDTALPARIATAIAQQPVISAQAQVRWERILAGPANPQTAHHGAALFVQLEPDARRRWAQRLRWFQPSQQDHLWAMEHNINARWMLFLRPLRLLSKHGSVSAWRILFPRLEAKPPAS
jgi:Uncharacterised nucleotidyltransferase